ncbi:MULTISPECIES: DNA-binding domain-containing protein [unclassified Roseitalea]|uniref:HvfC/BufC N-terminal domain-containing protein n=1 Tax=unclassified Roseitalea TaxID=2639107 RepID=UPI00273F312D|nr:MULTISPECIES: DNA-binding domain-containing protein [unclassified Roseitalea]
MPLPSDRAFAYPLDAAGFGAGLLDPARAKPQSVTGAHGKAAEKCYNVYRNNVTVSLIDALADIYPAVQELVGERFFRAMARDYVRAHPPSSPLLFRYGEGFADFIEGFAPARELAYLPDVARLERAWLTAYHAADREPIAPDELASIPQDRVGEIGFEMHPAFALVASRFSLFRLFMMNRGFMPLERIDASLAEPVMVTRPQADVAVTRLAPGEPVFLARLAAGDTLGQAAAEALAAETAFDLGHALASVLAAGAAVAIRAPAGTTAHPPATSPEDR